MLKKVSVGCFIGVMLLNNVLFAQGEEMPKPEAESVWQYITQEKPFTDWSFWPDHQGTNPSNAPHAPKHKIYVNTQALHSKQPPLQDGSMVVKYNLSPADEVKAITLMYKVKGYNPDAGDWFWVQYSPTGEVYEAGKLEKCIGCHAAKSASDYILVHKFNN
ncbi:MAG: cytochrome P460 family protein [Candidatus Electrothrix sp. GW3-4]|uniref:cytochrome P460 family protein n=1 Tax=Candidatus Electrothrix sp. GW3-4 TaxID=3126740 RepID=UPI0030CFDF50